MTAWIRVDVRIGRTEGILRMKRILEIDRATAVGHLVLLEAELAEHRPTGELEGMDPLVLAEWAGFEGSSEKWIEALAALTEHGKLCGWDERHGRRVEELARDAERKRLKRESERKTSAGRPPDILEESVNRTPDVAAQSTGQPGDGVRNPAVRNGDGTERNETSTTSSSSARERFLDSVKDRQAWEQEFRMCEAGERGPTHRATAEQIETTCRDYLANGHGGRPNLMHWRAHLRRVIEHEHRPLRVTRSAAAKAPSRSGPDYAAAFKP